MASNRMSFGKALALGAALALSPVSALAQKSSGGEQSIVSLRRLTEGEYRRSIADIFGPEVQVQGRFEPAVRRDGLLAIGNAQATVSSAGMEQYYAMAYGIADQLTGKAGRAKYMPCTPASASKPDDSCARAIFAKYGRLLYRRPLGAGELTTLTKTAHKAATDTHDFYAGLHETLGIMLASPQFLFRVERSITSSDGARSLDSYARASRLSFFFWDAPPDDALLTAAENGDLITQDGLARQVDRLTSSPRVKDGLTAVFEDMLQFDLFSSQIKDPQRYPKYSQVVAEQSRQQTIRTILDLLVTKNGDYRDLFTSPNTFLTRDLALVYNVPYVSRADWSPYTFAPEADRVGILSEISFLSLFAHPAQSSPTKRGVAMNEIFLCQPIPPPPADVDFSAVNGSGPDRKKTARLRLDQHRTNPTCAACHAVFDPPGLTLEKFDALGQARTMEDGVPIDVSSTYLGKTLSGPKDLGQWMHDNPATTSCIARNLFATGTGRTPLGEDNKILAEFGKAFASDGYRVPSLMKAMAASSAFFSIPMPRPSSK